MKIYEKAGCFDVESRAAALEAMKHGKQLDEKRKVMIKRINSILKK